MSAHLALGPSPGEGLTRGQKATLWSKAPGGKLLTFWGRRQKVGLVDPPPYARSWLATRKVTETRTCRETEERLESGGVLDLLNFSGRSHLIDAEFLPERLLSLPVC